jgi:hypothetical protein
MLPFSKSFVLRARVNLQNRTKVKNKKTFSEFLENVFINNSLDLEGQFHEKSL